MNALLKKNYALCVPYAILMSCEKSAKISPKTAVDLQQTSSVKTMVTTMTATTYNTLIDKQISFILAGQVTLWVDDVNFSFGKPYLRLFR